MFLLEGAFGRVLHTGDFRWELARQPAPAEASGAEGAD